MADAQEKVGAWLERYSAERSHRALGNIAPKVLVWQASALASRLDSPE